MHQSIPSFTIPQANFQNIVKSPPPGKFFGQISGGRASLGPLILINFTLFHHFQDLNH